MRNSFQCARDNPQKRHLFLTVGVSYQVRGVGRRLGQRHWQRAMTDNYDDEDFDLDEEISDDENKIPTPRNKASTGAQSKKEDVDDMLSDFDAMLAKVKRDQAARAAAMNLKAPIDVSKKGRAQASTGARTSSGTSSTSQVILATTRGAACSTGSACRPSRCAHRGEVDERRPIGEF